MLKRSPIQRTPWKRQPPTGLRPARSIIKPASARTLTRRATEKPIRDWYKSRHPVCEMNVLMPGMALTWDRYTPCLFHATDLHEPWTRAQGGPTDDPRNFAHLCRNCHDWLDTVEGRRWGVAHGFRVAKGQGAAWLAAGGRMAA